MPPRPRPRPRVAPAALTPSASSPDAHCPPPGSSTSTQAILVSQTEAEIEAEDELFIKHRTAESWKKIDELEKQKARSGRARTPDSSENEDGKGHGRKHNKKLDRESSLPSWTKSKAKAILVVSSDEDEDPSSANGTRRSSNGSPGRKRKRARSRSKSITPPPGLSAQQLQIARNLVRQTLEIAPRRVSPTLSDDDEVDVEESTDTIVLDPEFARITEELRQAKASGSIATNTTPLEAVGGPEFVLVKVRWRPHLLDTARQPQIWTYKMRRGDNFTRAFEETAGRASVLAKNLIVLHDNKRVFSSATPHSLGVWAEVELDASDKATYEHTRTNRVRSPSAAPQPGPRAPSRTRSPSAAPSRSHSDSSPEPSGSGAAAGEGETFRLTLRSERTEKDVVLTVRPTTRCDAIVRAFAGRAKLQVSQHALAQARIVVDGDKMGYDVEIGEADLEDGDLVEVVGL